jgi:hypothetical protein
MDYHYIYRNAKRVQRTSRKKKYTGLVVGG